MGLENVRHVVLVLSGKGGVGKSSVTIQLALALTQQGHNVGILDIDLTGPSVPRLLNLEDKKVTQAPGGWLPVQVHPAISNDNPSNTNGHTFIENATSVPTSVPSHEDQPQNLQHNSRGSLHALSLAFLLPSRSSAVIWRGPKKTAMIRQFLSDVFWPPGTDYLLIDTPPGTSDEHIAVVEELHKLTAAASDNAPQKLQGAVVVTTPQAISTSDVRKELNFCIKTSVPVLGVVENMAGFMCPCCGEISNVFSKGGGEVMARECGVEFLGSVPVDTEFGSLVEGRRTDSAENGQVATKNEGEVDKELVERYRTCKLNHIFEGFAARIVQQSRTPG
jgi:Mrp family chromosome partitioning ATPase